MGACPAYDEEEGREDVDALNGGLVGIFDGRVGRWIEDKTYNERAAGK